jgi:hypothetical protein
MFVALLSICALNDGAAENEPDGVFLAKVPRSPSVPVALHLPPSSADHVLVDRSYEQPDHHPLDLACVGLGEVN